MSKFVLTLNSGLFAGTLRLDYTTEFKKFNSKFKSNDQIVKAAESSELKDSLNSFSRLEKKQRV